MTSTTLTAAEAASAIVALANASPRIPRPDEIEAIIARVVVPPSNGEGIFGHPPGKPITRAADIEFERIVGSNGEPLKFEFTNEQFASDFCPTVRVAFLVNGYDRDRLRSFVHQLTHDPADPEADALFALLNDWERVRDKLGAIAHFAEVAWARTVAVAEALSDEEGEVNHG